MRQPRGGGWRAWLALIMVAGLLLSACDLLPPAATTPTPVADTAPPSDLGNPPAGNPPAGSAPAGNAPDTVAMTSTINSGGSIGQQVAPTATAAGQAAPPAEQPTTPPANVNSNPPAPAATPTPAPPPSGVTAATSHDNLKGMIAYVGLDFGIWIMPKAANTWQRIVDRPGAAVGPNSVPGRLVWSPNGRRLMYTVLPSAAGQPYTLFVWDADSGKVLNLGNVVGEYGSTTLPTGAWLPDSSQVAIARPNGTIAIFDVSVGQEVAQLGKGTSPVWVPPAGTCSAGASTSNTIAVVRDNNIWLIDYPPHSGGERQLTKYGAPSSASWAMFGLQYIWDCRLLFVGDPTGGLGAQGNGMAVYGVNLVNGSGADKPLVDRGGRIQQLALSSSGNYLGITEDVHVNACIAAGDARITAITGSKVADVPLQYGQQGYHAHMYGISFAPRGDTSLVVSYSQHYCDSPDPATIKSPVGPRIYLMDLNAPSTIKYIADGSWPAWNPGTLGLGTAPDTQIAGR